MQKRAMMDGLTPAQLRARLDERHGSGTLGLIGIMQVAALAIGFEHAFSLADTPAGLDTSTMIYADIGFMCLVTFYFYFLLASSLPLARPSLLQLLIPFSAAVAELAMAKTLGEPRRFLAAYLAFIGWSIGGFLYVLVQGRTARLAPELAGLKPLIAAELRKNIVCLVLLAAATAAALSLYPDDGSKPAWIDWGLVGVSAIISAGMVFLTEFRFVPAIYELADEPSR